MSFAKTNTRDLKGSLRRVTNAKAPRGDLWARYANGGFHVFAVPEGTNAR